MIKFNLNPWPKGDVGNAVRVDKDIYIPWIIQIYLSNVSNLLK